MNKELKIVKSLDSNEAYEIINNNIIGIVICETNPDIKELLKKINN